MRFLGKKGVLWKNVVKCGEFASEKWEKEKR